MSPHGEDRMDNVPNERGGEEPTQADEPTWRADASDTSQFDPAHDPKPAPAAGPDAIRPVGIPGDPGEVEETRAIEATEPAESTAIEPHSDPDSDSDPAASVEAIDPISIHGPPRPGQVFFGRYIVEKQIGEG